MAGRGMGAATAGGGCVEKGPKNKMVKATSKTTGPVMMAEGGDVSPRKRMAMGMKDGGYASKMHKMPDGSMMKGKKHPKKMKMGGSC
jgi:hypothetical protein